MRLADDDLKDMLPRLLKGGFYHAGQVCVSVQRVYVHEEICQSVAQSMAAMANALIVGDPLDPSTEVGPLISIKEVDRIEQWVNEAKARDAEILCGGKRLSDSCYAPTVVLNPPDDIAISTHEIFGPVVCIYSYQNRLEAIQRANSLPFSFQAAIFTKNIDVALDSVNRLSAKAVMVNDHTAFRVDWMPFGGSKESGLGVGGIAYAMRDMSEEKLMVIRSDMLPT